MKIKIESQIKMFQAPVSCKASSMLNTPVINKSVTAKNATKAELSCGILKNPERTQSKIAKEKTIAMIFSGSNIGPISFNLPSAQFLALGVSLISGGYIL